MPNVMAEYIWPALLRRAAIKKLCVRVCVCVCARDLVVVDALLAAPGVRLVALRVHTQQGHLYDPVEYVLLVRGGRHRSRSDRPVPCHDRRLHAHLQQGTQCIQTPECWSWVTFLTPNPAQPNPTMEVIT